MSTFSTILKCCAHLTRSDHGNDTRQYSFRAFATGTVNARCRRARPAYERNLPCLARDTDDIEPSPVHALDAGKDPAQMQVLLMADISKFNQGQREIFNKVVGSVMASVPIQILDGAASSTTHCPLPPSQRVFSLDASGVTCKTFVIRAIHTLLYLKGRTVNAVVSSAVEPKLLDNGHTAHSTFRIPISIDPDCTCNIATKSSTAEGQPEVHLITFNEIFM